VIDKRLKYKAGQRVKKNKDGSRPGYRGYGAAQDSGNASNSAASAAAGSGSSSGGDGDGSTNRERGLMSRGLGPKGTTGSISGFEDGPGVDRSAVGPTSTYASNKFRAGMIKSLKEVAKNPKYGGGGFFSSGLGKIIKNIAKTAAFAYAPPIVGKINTGLQVASVAKDFLDTTGLSEKIGLRDVNVKDAFSNIGKGSTKTGPKGSPREEGDGGEPNQQNALMSEYLLLLQKMEQGVLQKEEQTRFNSLKSRLGKAYGGIMNVNMNRGQLGGMNG
jgi:hypothetical protein